jgi:hypothetical protein
MPPSSGLNEECKEKSSLCKDGRWITFYQRIKMQFSLPRSRIETTIFCKVFFSCYKMATSE